MLRWAGDDFDQLLADWALAQAGAQAVSAQDKRAVLLLPGPPEASDRRRRGVSLGAVQGRDLSGAGQPRAARGPEPGCCSIAPRRRAQGAS